MMQSITQQFAMNDQQRQKIVQGLEQLLANSYILYIKTHNYHWNVTGANFYSLHLLFEELYQNLATAVDTIAERIRQLGFKVNASYQHFINKSDIKEETKDLTSEQMVQQLIEDNLVLIQVIRQWMPTAESLQDVASSDLMAERARTHEKQVWMLRSTIV